MSDKRILTAFNALVENLNKTHGTNEKIELLAAHKDLVALIERIWNPMTKTGVTRNGLTDFRKKNKTIDVSKYKDMSLYSVFDALCERTITGDLAKSVVWNYIERYNEYEDLLLRIFEKKPRIRMSEKLVLKAFPGIFKLFRVTLAEDWDESDLNELLEEHKSVIPPAYISDKIDGVRLICIITLVNGHPDVKFYSRSGQQYKSLGRLTEDAHELIKRVGRDEMTHGVVLDGELIALDADGRENFKETVSQVRKLEIQMTNPRYKVFDILTLDEFNGVCHSDLYSVRYARYKRLLGGMRHIEPLEQTPFTPHAFKEQAERMRHLGGEGLIVRFNHQYEPKRTKRLLKYKFFNVEEFRVEDVEITKMPFPNASGGEDFKDALRHIKILFKDNPVWVGSGFNTAERLHFAKHPEEILHQTVMIQYQEAFYDKRKKTWSLRIPIFKALVGKTREF